MGLLQYTGLLSSSDKQVQLPRGTRDLSSQPGIKPALQGRFLTPGPPGKSHRSLHLNKTSRWFWWMLNFENKKLIIKDTPFLRVLFACDTCFPSTPSYFWPHKIALLPPEAPPSLLLLPLSLQVEFESQQWTLKGKIFKTPTNDRFQWKCKEAGLLVTKQIAAYLAIKNVMNGTSLVVLWLRLHASGAVSVPGRRTKIPYATWHSQKKKKKMWWT